MALHDLLPGHGPQQPSVGSLGSLVRPAVATVIERAEAMSLPAALNARARGQIVAPAGADDGLAGMVTDPDPLPRRQPAPTPDWRSDPIFQEARVQHEVDRAEMRHRIAERRRTSIEAAQQWMEAQNV
jgi:hypothetical protein